MVVSSRFHAASVAGKPSVPGSMSADGQQVPPVASSLAASSGERYAPSSSSARYTRHAPASSACMVKVPTLLSRLYVVLIRCCLNGLKWLGVPVLDSQARVAINYEAREVAQEVA